MTMRRFPYTGLRPVSGLSRTRNIVDQNSLALGQDGVVGDVPGDPETLGDPGDAQVLHHVASRAHRSLQRDTFARGSTARLVSWRHACSQPVHR